MSDTASIPAIPSAIQGGQSNPFNPRMVLGFVAVGCIAFLLLLYFLAIGDTGERNNDGQAHAASNGLNGFSGLVELLEKQGRDVKASRSLADLDTSDLLVLTPPMFTDGEELGELLEKRSSEGPTIVILPKWWASDFSPFLPDEVTEKIKEGWVQLGMPSGAGWTSDMPEPYAFDVHMDSGDKATLADFSGMGLAGKLPTPSKISAEDEATELLSLVGSGSEDALVLSTANLDDGNAYAVTFVIEPDLMNNFGMADKTRAQLALELIEEATY